MGNSSSKDKKVLGNELNNDPRLRSIARVLERNSYQYNFVRQDKKVSIHSSPTIAGRSIKLVVKIDDVLRVQFVIFGNLPEATRSKIGECCVRANYGMKMGHFDMDWRDGETLYNLRVPLEEITAQDIESCFFPPILRLGVATLKLYIPAFFSVRDQGIEPAAAIAAVEKADEVDENNVDNEHLKACARFMRANEVKFSYNHSQGGCTIDSGFVLAGHQVQMKIFAAEILKVRLFVFKKSPEISRYELAEAASRANFGLKVGHFDFDYNDGELCFEVIVPMEKITPEECEKCYFPSLFGIALGTTKKYVPALLEVHNGGKSAREAIGGVEGGTGGNGGIGEVAQQLMRELIAPNAQNPDMLLDSCRLSSITKKLGQGAMGAVYACTYASLPVVAKEVKVHSQHPVSACPTRIAQYMCVCMYMCISICMFMYVCALVFIYKLNHL